MYQTALLLLCFRCDAPLKFLFIIQHLRRSLPRAKRRVAHMYCNNSIQQYWHTDDTDKTDKHRSVLICNICVIRVLLISSDKKVQECDATEVKPELPKLVNQ